MSSINLAQWVQEAEEKKVSLGYLVMEKEGENSEQTINQLKQDMLERWLVMEEAVQTGLSQDIRSMGGLIGGEGKTLYSYHKSKESLIGGLVCDAVAKALAVAEVNASMGKIVAAPTAGSCGILPGVLSALKEHQKLKDEQIVEALFTAAGIGVVIGTKATLSGALGGCQAECGAGAAMAAAATVELAGGSPSQAVEAVAFVMKNAMGQICDPVAGLVEVPCAKRNGMGAASALVAADMALAGIKSVIPVDEVIIAMGEVGKALPEAFRETAKGGVAKTPTGKKITEKIFG